MPRKRLNCSDTLYGLYGAVPDGKPGSFSWSCELTEMMRIMRQALPSFRGLPRISGYGCHFHHMNQVLRLAFKPCPAIEDDRNGQTKVQATCAAQAQTTPSPPDSTQHSSQAMNRAESKTPRLDRCQKSRGLIRLAQARSAWSRELHSWLTAISVLTVSSVFHVSDLHRLVLHI